jgi:hypothetical protein
VLGKNQPPCRRHSDVANHQDIELPFLTGKKEDITEMRKLLEQSGYQLKKFPQVTGKIENLMTEVVLGTKDALNLKDINTNPGFYKGWKITLEGSEGQSGTSTIVDYRSVSPHEISRFSLLDCFPLQRTSLASTRLN